jgi:hypothetical protein
MRRRFSSITPARNNTVTMDGIAARMIRAAVTCMVLCYIRVPKNSTLDSPDCVLSGLERHCRLALITAIVLYNFVTSRSRS